MTTHELIELLQSAGIQFTLTTVRNNAVMFCIAVPGERWEAEVFDDGHVELECFRSAGDISDASALLTLINQHKD